VDDAAGDAPNADDLGDQNANNYVYNTIGQLTEDVSEGVFNLKGTTSIVLLGFNTEGLGN
jgi:hypothetical protein